MSDVSTRLRRDLDPLRLSQVSGRISVREDFESTFDILAEPPREDGRPTFGIGGHAISLTDFSLQTEDGLSLPATTISETYVPARKGQPEKTEITAKSLDLHTLAEFIERLPLPAAQHKMLVAFEPRGQLKNFSAQWQGTYPDISSYSVNGEFSALSLKAQPPRAARPKTATTPAQAALPGIPGFENLSGRVDANDRGGAFVLGSKDLKLHLPGYFADPVMPFEELNMDAHWRFQDHDQLLLEVKKMQFRQQALEASFSGKHQMPLSEQAAGALGDIDITGTIARFDLAQIGRYLPLATPTDTQHWLIGALQGGSARDLKLRLKGPLADFPFGPGKAGEKPKGEFHVAGKIDNGRLIYVPDRFAKDGKSPLWPALEKINGSIQFDRTRMEIRAASAVTHGVDMSNVKAIVPDLLSDDMQLNIDGSAAGPLQHLLRYTIDSPVAEMIGDFTVQSRATGNARLGLKLSLPLHRIIDTKVQGTVQFLGNEVVLFNGMPAFQGVTGRLDFNELGMNLAGVKGNFIGGPFALSGGTQKDDSILIKADGSATAAGLRKAYPTLTMQKLSERFVGGARYNTTISVRKKRTELLVESNMQGMGLDFPAPLTKAAADSMPLRLEMSMLPGEGGTLQDEIKLSLGTAISARYLRQKNQQGDAPWRVLQGGIGVNVPAPQPDSGLIASVHMKSLNIDAWNEVVGTIIGSGGSTTAPAEEINIAQYIEPEILAARADELIVGGKKLDHVVVGASNQKGLWQANIDSTQASGYVSWNGAVAGQGAGRATARLSSLIVPKSAASDVSDLLEGKTTATQIPGLDIVAENFELFGKKLGRLELVANNVAASATREWRIERLSLKNEDADLKATGKWSSVRDGESVSSLAYTLKIGNAGDLLTRFGFPGTINGGKGLMEGDISWKGLPFALDIPSLSGQFKLDLESGQFLKVDPGAAKLLSVLSLQALPRRLSLDFRDVFSDGFAFDGIAGDVTISRGLAKTDNFKMRSVSATVLMDGSADIARETQNLHVIVLPEINAGAASVVYALAVNPVIGVGTFLAQLFLREPLIRAFTYEYAITGPWQEPVVTKLGRNIGAPTPAPRPAPTPAAATASKAG